MPYSQHCVAGQCSRVRSLDFPHTVAAAAAVLLEHARSTGGKARGKFGAQLTQGVGQAAIDFNKSSGILGQKIVIETGDDGGKKIVIVDEATGRRMPDRHWRDGLHPSAKEYAQWEAMIFPVAQKLLVK